MNSENRKIFSPHSLVVSPTDATDRRKGDVRVVLINRRTYYTWKNIKSNTKTSYQN